MLDLLYAQGAHLRRRWYERHPEARRWLERPVISVGNLSVGGTGKTPLVREIAAWLIARGERPAILSRGYGRRLRLDGAVVVSDGNRIVAGLDVAGDEPLLLARSVPQAIVVVAEDRYLAGTLAERRLGATVHLLDDGFQHVQLGRDLDVLVTFPGETTDGRVLPLGRLRESASAAARAHVAVVVGADAAAARSEAWTLGVSQSCGARRVLDVADARVPLFAFAGIGQPDVFFRGLREAGASIVGTRPFPDHHRYTAGDLRALVDAARAAGAERLVTTEKDEVRLEAAGDVGLPVDVARLSLALDPWDALGESIEAALSRARHRISEDVS